MLARSKPILKKEKITADRLNRLGPEFYIVYINMRIISYINGNFGGIPGYKNIKDYQRLAKQKITELKLQSEKKANRKDKKIPINKTTTTMAKGVVAGGAALYVGGHVAGAATKIIAPAANTLVKISMRNAFGIFSDVSAPLSYIADKANGLIGGAVSKLVAGIIPIPLLYISVLELSKLFFFGLGKTQSFFKKKFMPGTEDLSFLPNEGPLLAFICNLSTLTILNKLTTELQTRNLQSVKFNFLALINNVKNLSSDKELSKEDLILRDIVAKNINKLKKIGKKAASKPERLKEYTALGNTKKILRLIKLYAVSELSEEMIFWSSVFGKLIQAQQEHIQHSFLDAFDIILKDDTYANFYDPHTYENIGSIESILAEPTNEQNSPFNTSDQASNNNFYQEIHDSPSARSNLNQPPASVDASHSYAEAYEPRQSYSDLYRYDAYDHIYSEIDTLSIASNTSSDQHTYIEIDNIYASTSTADYRPNVHRATSSAPRAYMCSTSNTQAEHTGAASRPGYSKASNTIHPHGRTNNPRVKTVVATAPTYNHYADIDHTNDESTLPLPRSQRPHHRRNLTAAIKEAANHPEENNASRQHRSSLNHYRR